ncbi:MAG: NTF2-like N-terminal transpeptidase domain-containing protein [Chitinophagaceae bacterium]
MNRFTRFLMSSLLIASIFTGCKKSPGPDQVAMEFLTAIQQSDYTQAKNYATDDSKAMLDALSSFQKMLPASSQEKIKNEKFNIRSVEIKDSFAIVTYDSNMDTTGKILKLKRENGLWKVAFTKETILPELNKPLNENDSTLMTPDSSLLQNDSSGIH